MRNQNEVPLLFMIYVMKTYATYRAKPLNQWSGLYTPSYFFDQMFWDYKKAGLTSIDDWLIDESRYTGELVPWVKKLTKFLVGNYNDQYVAKEAFEQSLLTTGSEFHISLFATVEEAKQWIRDNTDLVEELDWNFILSEANDLNPEVIHLTIE